MDHELLTLSPPARNVTRDAGGSLKLRCEVAGQPRATAFQWYKNEAPVLVERGRVRNAATAHLQNLHFLNACLKLVKTFIVIDRLIIF